MGEPRVFSLGQRRTERAHENETLMFPQLPVSATCQAPLAAASRPKRRRTSEERTEGSEVMNATTKIRWAGVIAAGLAGLVIGTGLRPAHANQGPERVPAFSEERAVEASSSHTEQKSEAAISIEAPLVNVNVLVTDQDGRVLSGLKRENFRVLDNGKAQVITHVEPTSAPITIAMLMEYSGTA